MHGESVSWDTEGLLQKMAIRKEDESGNLTLEFADFNPLPTGVTAKDIPAWDTTTPAAYKLHQALDAGATGSIQFGDTIVSDVADSNTAKKLLKVTKSALPTISVATATPTTAGTTVTVLTSAAKDGTDKGKINFTAETITITPGDAAEITISAIDGGTASPSSVTLVSGIAVDTTDKHKLKVTSKSVPIPEVSVSVTGNTAAGNSFTALTNAVMDGTDKHKINFTQKAVTIPEAPNLTPYFDYVSWDSTDKAFKFRNGGSTGTVVGNAYFSAWDA
jgi:hypothetical protein